MFHILMGEPDESCDVCRAHGLDGHDVPPGISGMVILEMGPLDEVLRCELLCAFIRGMIAADPGRRFPSAEAAELLKEGAAAFHRQLVMGNLSSEYDNDIRLWLEELKELDAQDSQPSEAA